MKTNELQGAALDWAVAKCEGYACQFDDEVSGAWLIPQEGYLHAEKPLSLMRYSTNWAQGGPIIERERLWLQPEIGKEGAGNAWYCVAMSAHDAYGETPLIAAMRCLVASKLGDEIEVPEGLHA